MRKERLLPVYINPEVGKLSRRFMREKLGKANPFAGEKRSAANLGQAS